MKNISLLLLAGALTAALPAFAQDGGVTCDTVHAGSTPVYLGGSTALQPFVKSIAPSLYEQANSYTLFYFGGGSCVGVNNVVDPVNNPLAASTQMTYYENLPADGGVATKTCSIAASQNGKLDLAISDVFEETCTSAQRPATIGDAKGPAQSMVFVVPNGSDVTAITAEEAYIVFGFGGKTNIAPPWQVADPMANFFIRNNKSGTQLILSGVIGVPAAKWQGFDSGGSGTVFSKLTGQSGAAAESSIGILGLDYLDQKDTDGTPRRSKVKMLALAAKGQKYAYFPDSTHSSFDKKNLREGRYDALGYAHFIANLDANGDPTPAKVKYISDLLTLKTVTPAPGFNVAQQVIKAGGLVPLCAMKVTRSAEGGDLSPYTDPAPCGCYFDTLISGTPQCASCAGGASCAAGSTCRNDLCEPNN